MAHLEVEVVGRLVEQQQVRAPRDHQREHQPRLLAAGERRHRLEHPLAGKPKPPRNARCSARGARASAAPPARQMPRAASRRRRAARSGAARNSRSPGPPPPMRAPRSSELHARPSAPRQRRLAGAVAAEQRDAVAGLELREMPPSTCGRRSRPRRRASVKQRARQARRRRELELERRVDVRRRDPLHPLQPLQPALRLARLARLGAEALDEACTWRDLALLALVGRCAARACCGALSLEGRSSCRCSSDALPSRC